MGQGPKLKRFGYSFALVAASFLVAAMMAEGLLRLRYAEPLRVPSPEVLAIQPHLRLDALVGFAWNRDVNADQDIVFSVMDAEFEPLSTDGFGFINHPDAIADRESGITVDIVGLGDSFMEHAAHTFYDFFHERGMQYYGMAVHRQAPPQYTAILERHALELKPRWVLYGIFENDFEESVDFEDWRASGLDWFTFHSGTWCGPSRKTTTLGRFQERHLAGSTGLYRVVLSRLRGDNATLAGPSDFEVDLVFDAAVRAHELARSAGADLLVVLIPGRGTAVVGSSPESEAYDTLLRRFAEMGTPVLDLREAFWAVADPASLYYRQDGHWNRRGMELAAEAIFERMGAGSGEHLKDLE